MRKGKIDRRRVLSEFNSIDYDYSKFSIDSFVEAIELKFRRKFYFLSGSLPATIQGIWVSNADLPAEYIFFEKSLPEVHLLHVQLHEISHFLCGHETLRVSTEELKRLAMSGERDLFENISPNLARFRNEGLSNGDLVEEEAEAMANLILTKAISERRRVAEMHAHKHRARELFHSLGLD